MRCEGLHSAGGWGAVAWSSRAKAYACINVLSMLTGMPALPLAKLCRLCAVPIELKLDGGDVCGIEMLGQHFLQELYS